MATSTMSDRDEWVTVLETLQKDLGFAQQAQQKTGDLESWITLEPLKSAYQNLLTMKRLFNQKQRLLLLKRPLHVDKPNPVATASKVSSKSRKRSVADQELTFTWIKKTSVDESINRYTKPWECLIHPSIRWEFYELHQSFISIHEIATKCRDLAYPNSALHKGLVDLINALRLSEDASKEFVCKVAEKTVMYEVHYGASEQASNSCSESLPLRWIDKIENSLDPSGIFRADFYNIQVRKKVRNDTKKAETAATPSGKRFNQNWYGGYHLYFYSKRENSDGTKTHTPLGITFPFEISTNFTSLKETKYRDAVWRLGFCVNDLDCSTVKLNSATPEENDFVLVLDHFFQGYINTERSLNEVHKLCLKRFIEQSEAKHVAGKVTYEAYRTYIWPYFFRAIDYIKENKVLWDNDMLNYCFIDRKEAEALLIQTTTNSMLVRFHDSKNSYGSPSVSLVSPGVTTYFGHASFEGIFESGKYSLSEIIRRAQVHRSEQGEYQPPLKLTDFHIYGNGKLGDNWSDSEEYKYYKPFVEEHASVFDYTPVRIQFSFSVKPIDMNKIKYTQFLETPLGKFLSQSGQKSNFKWFPHWGNASTTSSGAWSQTGATGEQFDQKVCTQGDSTSLAESTVFPPSFCWQDSFSRTMDVTSPEHPVEMNFAQWEPFIQTEYSSSTLFSPGVVESRFTCEPSIIMSTYHMELMALEPILPSRGNLITAIEGMYGSPIPATPTRLYYHNCTQPKGMALVICNERFRSYHPDRVGSDIDFTNVKKLFTALGYTVTDKKDATAEEIQLTAASFVDSCNEDDHPYDSCLIYISTYAVDGRFIGVDGERTEIESFLETLVNCQKFLGKPKIFVIQGCRQPGLVSFGADITNVTDKSNVLEKIQDAEWKTQEDILKSIPAGDDAFILHSTTPGDYNWCKGPGHGSWFTQVFCESILENANKQLGDMATLIKIMNAKLRKKAFPKHPSLLLMNSTLLNVKGPFHFLPGITCSKCMKKEGT